MKGTTIPKKNASTIYPVSRRLDLKQAQLDQSNLGQVTNEVLRKHSSDTSKLICFSVSEGTLNDIAQAFQPEYGFCEDFPISVGCEGFPIPVDFRMRICFKLLEIKIDVDKKVITFVIKTCLEFYVPDPRPNVEDDRLALVEITFNVSAKPSLNIITSDDQQLQLTFSDATFTIDDDDINIIDVAGLAQVGCGTPEKFKKFIEDVIAPEIRSGRSGPYDTVLPPIVEGFPLPDQWNQHEGYRLHFEGFEYRSVTVGNVGAGYLFLIFDIQSLKYPPPCVCREEVEVLDRKQMLGSDPLLLASVGFSKQALIEIASSLLDIPGPFQKEEKWLRGILYGKITSYYKVHLSGASIEIHADAVFSEVAAEASGSVSAGIKEWTKQANTGASLTIKIRSAQITWRPNVQRDNTDPNKLVVYLNPSFNMTTPIIELRSDLPGWADKVTSWVLSNTIGELLKASITAAVASGSMLGIFHFKVEEPCGNIQYDYVNHEFFENESIVIIGALYYKKGDPDEECRSTST